MDGDNGAAAPAPDSASDEKPLEAAAEVPQQEGDAATDAQEISRKIDVPNSKVYYSQQTRLLPDSAYIYF
jgi:far upstream element-binding protein